MFSGGGYKKATPGCKRVKNLLQNLLMKLVSHLNVFLKMTKPQSINSPITKSLRYC